MNHQIDHQICHKICHQTPWGSYMPQSSTNLEVREEKSLEVWVRAGSVCWRLQKLFITAADSHHHPRREFLPHSATSAKLVLKVEGRLVASPCWNEHQMCFLPPVGTPYPWGIVLCGSPQGVLSIEYQISPTLHALPMLFSLS